MTIGASVGIAIGDPGRASADALVRNADLALYAAKAAGRGKHCFYEPSMHSEAAERQLLENDLRQAIERGELCGRLPADRPRRGRGNLRLRGAGPLEPPDARRRFRPTSSSRSPKNAGLIGKIGEWVLRTALEEAAQLARPRPHRGQPVAAPVQRPGRRRHGRAAISSETGVRAERLELEITEGVFLAEGDTTDETFAKLKALGVRLALDDFGTGYSLARLFEEGAVRQDQDRPELRPRRGLDATNRNAAIIRAIVTLAETLGMDTCAEGVETHDDLQLIRELGVSMVQGYIFGRPSAAETARELANSVDGRSRRLPLHPRAAPPADAPRDHRDRRRDDRGEAAQHLVDGRAGRMRRCRSRPGTELTIDIVGVGPVRGIVRWAQAGKFGVQFGEQFDLARLAPKKEKPQRRDDAAAVVHRPAARAPARRLATCRAAARSLP